MDGVSVYSQLYLALTGILAWGLLFFFFVGVWHDERRISYENAHRVSVVLALVAGMLIIDFILLVFILAG